MKKITRGFTLVEVLIATFVMLLMVTTAGAVEVRYLTISNSYTRILQANYVAEQTFSLVRLIRDKNLMADPTKDSLPECANPSITPGCFPNDNSATYYITAFWDSSTGKAQSDLNNPDRFTPSRTQPVPIDGISYIVKIYIYK